MDGSELERRLRFALDAARAAGEVAMEVFDARAFEVVRKADGSPVTEADRRVERLLRERIADAYPRDGVLGEEEEALAGESGCTWILDPIDGTRSFVQGVPLFGTLIGLEEEGEPVLGVAHHPGVGETVTGAAGLGAWWHRRGEPPRPARVSDEARLAHALCCTTSIRNWSDVGRRDAYLRLLEGVGLDRGWSDCYGLILVATGRADLLAEPVMYVWDCAPFVPILEEAGGRFTDLEGRRTIRGGSGLATNGLLHEPALALLRS